MWILQRSSRVVLVFFLVGGWLSFPALGGEPDEVRIALVADGSSPAAEELIARIQTEILALAEGEFDVRFGPSQGPEILAGDWTAPSVAEHVEAVLADPEIDLVIAMGAIASHGFCCREELSKPVIAALVLDADLQSLPRAPGGGSGIENLNYLAFPQSIASDIEEFRRIVPFRKLTVVFNRWFFDVLPELASKFAAIVAEQGIEPSLVLVGDSFEDALLQIPDDTEAVYVAPIVHLDRDARRRFYDGLAARRLPSFALFGIAELQDGAFAAQRDVTFYERLARRVALNVQRILLGEPASQLAVTVPDRQRLTINMETARRIDIYPPWEVLAEAEVLNEEPDFVREHSLETVVEEAVEANLDLLAARREVLAGAQEIERARSRLRPRVEISATGLVIDDDRANPIVGQSERTWSGGLTVEQLVYSEPARAGVAIERSLQLGREAAFEELRLDIVLAASTAYLDVLRAKTFERIRREDLRLTRSNLELARVRQSVGTAGPGEVYRWQSSLAQARRALIEAQATRLQAVEAVNRLLHRPLIEGFDTRDVSLDDPGFLTSTGRISSYTGSPRHFGVFSQFQVEEGLGRAPELAQFDAALNAQERALASARRAFRLPRLIFQGSLDETLERGGEGSMTVPGAPDDTNWSLALLGRFDLFAGGARRADVLQAEERLEQLRAERDAVAERLEQRIRATLHQTRASAAGIRLSREAAQAAGRTLDVVADAYSRGTVDILDLLDAQNAALQAELSAADALYQFFIDFLEHQRSVDRFDFFADASDNAAFFDRLDTYFKEVGVDPRPPTVWWRIVPEENE